MRLQFNGLGLAQTSTSRLQWPHVAQLQHDIKTASASSCSESFSVMASLPCHGSLAHAYSTLAVCSAGQCIAVHCVLPFCVVAAATAQQSPRAACRTMALAFAVKCCSGFMAAQTATPALWQYAFDTCLCPCMHTLSKSCAHCCTDACCNMLQWTHTSKGIVNCSNLCDRHFTPCDPQFELPPLRRHHST